MFSAINTIIVKTTTLNIINKITIEHNFSKYSK